MIVAAVKVRPSRKTKAIAGNSHSEDRGAGSLEVLERSLSTTARRNRRAAKASIATQVEEPATEPSADLLDLARELSQQESEFIPNELFKQKAHYQEILAPAALVGSAPVAKATWKQVKEMPAHLARMCETTLLKPEEEKALFRRMNFAKFRAEQLRRKINLNAPVPAVVNEVASLLAQAAADRNRIVRANLRLVVSIAKKFSDLRNTFDELLSEGITSLLRAVEKFDFDRGFRFSTYATQAVRRTLCRLLQQNHRDRSRFLTSESTVFEEAADDAPEGTMTESRWHELKRALVKMLSKLDPRERAIIRRRFGLDSNDEVQTLQSLAGEMGVCKERVRQLEMRAMSKLRSMAEEIRLAPPEGV